jgi:hypothetical protein
VLTVIFTADDWNFVGGSGHFESIRIANGIGIWLRK